MATWWIDEPRILGSSHPSNADLRRLYGDGVRVIVCLLDETEQPARYDVAEAARLGYARHCIPVRDFHAPTVAQLGDFVKLVAAAAPDAKILVHCEGGLGRTGTMAAAYWISKGFSASDAIARVRKARPHAVESDEQRAVLQQFEADRST
jgi:atypical dual specificity phosphatase